MSRLRAPLFPILIASAFGAGSPDASAQGPSPAKLLLIYNTNGPDTDGNGQPDSLDVAAAYAARRGVPAANLLGLACSSTVAYSSYAPFESEIRSPITSKLNALGPKQIDVLVFCQDMPYRMDGTNQGTLALDHALQRPYSLPTNWTGYVFTGVPNPYFEASPTKGQDLGHFTHAFLSGNKQMYLAARLDGPTPDDALVLVERALYAEAYLWNTAPYLTGHGYVDTRFSSYPDSQLAAYPQGHGGYASSDLDLAYGKNFVLLHGWSLKWHNDSTDLEIGEGGLYHDGTSGLEAPAAVFYAGWYNFLKYQDVFTWVPGAVACDLDSLSLWNHRDWSTVSFGTQAFRRGLTACSGVLAEPYTIGHPFPEVLLYYMLHGFTFAEASTVSEPKLNWVSLHIGDPLYRAMASGKQPALDTTPPPAPSLAWLGTSPTAPTVRVRLPQGPTQGPELAVADLEIGQFGLLGAPIASSPIAHIRHDFALTGLAADAIYDVRATLRDPAGNTGAATSAILLTRAAMPVAVLAQTPQPAPAPSAPVELRFALKVAPDLSAGWSASLTMQHALLGPAAVDVTLPLLAFTTHVDLGAAGEALGVRISVPAGVLPPGVATFGIAATSGSGQDAHSVQVAIP
jgi:uncharacterized protein (TIGR03790 family)